MFKTIKQNINIGLLLILLVYYIVDLINIKIKHFKNFLKFYTKDERLGSIGNYYLISNSYNFTIFINTIKMLKNELIFDFTNYIYFIKNPFEFELYTSMIKSKLNFSKYNNLIFSELECQK